MEYRKEGRKMKCGKGKERHREAGGQWEGQVSCISTTIHHPC